ncbi:MAG TPA: DUF3098 domain-containing protein [Chitinophagaceae bacterium]|jgi:hypothetical protein|nr:DUF3098 domain-containing protein [Chitinophagaceae bacterium]
MAIKIEKDKIEKKVSAGAATAGTMFTKENYRWMLIGLVLIAVGMFVMSGGASKDPTVYDKSQIYSFTRITVAPILILAGLVVEIYALFKNPKKA